MWAVSARAGLTQTETPECIQIPINPAEKELFSHVVWKGEPLKTNSH
jgi:hypothetical protein